jgi:hypothetical protein
MTGKHDLMLMCMANLMCQLKGSLPWGEDDGSCG